VSFFALEIECEVPDFASCDPGALTSYVALCKRGGEAPFQHLTTGAGLRSPFEDGALDEVVEKAAATLGI